MFEILPVIPVVYDFRVAPYHGHTQNINALLYLKVYFDTFLHQTFLHSVARIHTK